MAERGKEGKRKREGNGIMMIIKHFAGKRDTYRDNDQRKGNRGRNGAAVRLGEGKTEASKEKRLEKMEKELESLCK